MIPVKGPVVVPDWPAQSPVPPATNTSTGKTVSKNPFFPLTFGKVFGNNGW
jgi:hypothetical protein